MDKHFILYGFLPFVELIESPFLFGPTLFCHSLEAKRFLSPIVETDRNALTTTAPMTCLLIHLDVPKEKQSSLVVDAFFLLYFASFFRKLYLDVYKDIQSIDCKYFTKVIPIVKWAKEKENWSNKELFLEKKLRLPIIDPVIGHALGNTLETLYFSKGKKESEKIQPLVRAIRYFVPCFLENFDNSLPSNPLTSNSAHKLGEDSLISSFLEPLFAPEKLVFLMTCFESLFALDAKHPAADLKQKLRSLLHLKFSRPVEILWKWVDGFYLVHKSTLKGENPDLIFRGNENQEVPYLYIGMKLFIYSVYTHLMKYELINEKDLPSPILTSEEALLFFWPETNLLRKLALLLTKVVDEKKQNDFLNDIQLLSGLYINFYECAFIKEALFSKRFIPSPTDQIIDSIRVIQQHASFVEFSPLFLTYLKKRVLFENSN